VDKEVPDLLAFNWQRRCGRHTLRLQSGDGIAFVQSLGADLVIDYAKQELFDALPDNSVDIVYDNYGAKGTADKAMHAIRPGGVYLVMDTGGGGTISKHPKAGVTQIAFGLADLSDHTKGLDIVKSMFDAGKLKPHTQATYSLAQVPAAFNVDTSGKVLGKLAITP
jgi:NADPH:quinone reductase-like Zn-dependent oxidoreductase